MNNLLCIVQIDFQPLKGRENLKASLVKQLSYKKKRRLKPWSTDTKTTWKEKNSPPPRISTSPCLQQPYLPIPPPPTTPYSLL
ncbi:MAG: hypothetical protein WA919_20410, partial [Coleofasciculaceae cyanobacterium]